MATHYATDYNNTQSTGGRMSPTHNGPVKWVNDSYTFTGAVAGNTVSFGPLPICKIVNVVLAFASFNAFAGMFTVSLAGTVMAKMNVENGSIRIPLTKELVNVATESAMTIEFEEGCDSTAGVINLTVVYI